MAHERMLVARIHGAGDLRLHEEPVPAPGPGELLVRVTAVGVCGSDVHWWQEGQIGGDRIETPLVLGHECAGVIESGPRAGERVAIDPAQTCGRCEYCERGEVNLCSALRFAGHAPQDGALRHWVAWPERCLVPLPAALSDADGAMLEPLGVALYAVDLGGVMPGMSVGVFGCGTIGLSVLQIARAAGAARLFATDLPAVPHRLAAARGIAATAVEAAVAAVRPGGRAILIGIPCEDRLSFPASTARRKDLIIRVVHRMKHTYPRTLRLVEQGLVDVRSQVTHHFPLAEVARAFAVAQRREGIKVVVDC